VKGDMTGRSLTGEIHYFGGRILGQRLVCDFGLWDIFLVGGV
jgi:hypothetical protein